MKSRTTITAVISLTCALSAQAHDPSEHKDKKGEKPRCEALKDMDPEAMDRDDPVVQALLKKCEKQLHRGDELPDREEDHDEND